MPIPLRVSEGGTVMLNSSDEPTEPLCFLLARFVNLFLFQHLCSFFKQTLRFQWGQDLGNAFAEPLKARGRAYSKGVITIKYHCSCAFSVRKHHVDFCGASFMRKAVIKTMSLVCMWDVYDLVPFSGCLNTGKLFFLFFTYFLPDLRVLF